MIKSNISHHKLQISGQNKMDSAWATWLVFLIAFLLGFAMWETSQSWQNYALFASILGSLLLVLKIGLWFSITLTKKSLTIKKSFLGLRYWILETKFDQASYDKKNQSLSFKSGKETILIEKFEGFEVDCLLITKGERRYEIGDKDDAEVIFSQLMKGIEVLKIPKLTTNR